MLLFLNWILLTLSQPLSRSAHFCPVSQSTFWQIGSYICLSNQSFTLVEKCLNRHESVYTVNRHEVVTYLCDTWAKACHLQLVTWTVTSSLEGYKSCFQHISNIHTALGSSSVLDEYLSRQLEEYTGHDPVKGLWNLFVCTVLPSYITVSLLVRITLLFWFATSHVPFHGLKKGSIDHKLTVFCTSCKYVSGIMDVTFTVLRTHSFW